MSVPRQRRTERETFGRIAHSVRLDTASALIEAATRTFGRITRVAVHASPGSRLRLMGELCLVDGVLETIEYDQNRAAQAALQAVPPQRALPAPRRALPKGAGR